jgi:hypothetical protein
MWTFSSFLAIVSRSMGSLVDVNNALCGKPTWSILSFGFVRIFSSKLKRTCYYFCVSSVLLMYHWWSIPNDKAFSRANERCLQNLYHHRNKTKGWLYNCFILGKSLLSCKLFPIYFSLVLFPSLPQCIIGFRECQCNGSPHAEICCFRSLADPSDWWI